MELKPGYKRSEVGVIPEDWDVDYIEDVALVATGTKNTQDRIEDGQYPFFVRSQTVERINSYSFDGEAVLTAGDGVGTGKVVHYVNGRFDVHQRVYRISNWRCCTALADSEIRLWWWPRYVSSMKYPKRCQYKHAKQKKYHVRNWAEYNEGLRRRGDLTVWFDEEAIANWKADKTGKPGGQRVYSDMAIETGLVVRMVYKLAYRQTEGFLHSIASLLGLGIEIPDYSTLCRRSRLLRKKLRIPKATSTQPIHLMIDSTGLRIHVGNARKPPKQRAWRKLHIAVDRETGNIVASELTASRARDATRVPALLTQIQAPLVSVAADSAYDKEAVYEAIEAHSPGRRTRVVIPPQRNATLSQNSNTAMQERDRHIRAIERHGRREWYKLSGYTKRSMVENAVYRYKAIIGPEMRARTLARQRVEHRIGCEILNKMAALGMPDTYCAG